MNENLNKGILHWLYKLFMSWSYWLSRGSKSILKSDTIDTNELSDFAYEESKKWLYESDQFFGIWNKITEPKIANLLTSGDCDDFASKLYYKAKYKNAYLFTYFPKNIKKAHTVLLVKTNSVFYIYNWGSLYICPTMNDVINKLQRYSRSNIISYHTAIFSNKKHRYVPVNKI